jgi:signal transduction histidine kinase
MSVIGLRRALLALAAAAGFGSGVVLAGYYATQSLRGLADRVEALDGRLHVVSPAGAGTIVTAELPCEP